MSLRFCAPFPLLCFFLHSAAPFAIFIYELWPLERVFVRLAANFFLQRPQDAAFEHGHYGHQCDCARTRAYTSNIFNVQVLTCCRHLAFSLLSFVLLVAEATDFYFYCCFWLLRRFILRKTWYTHTRSQISVRAEKRHKFVMKNVREHMEI